MNKDLKILSKEKRDELLQSKVYLESKDASSPFVLMIDQNIHSAGAVISNPNDLLQEDANQASTNTNNEIIQEEVGDDIM